MEISAYLCSRNPLHAAGGARPMHGSLLTRPLQPAKPKGGAALASYTNGDGARPKLGQAPAPTELAAPKNSPARRGSTTQKLNVIKTHTNMTTLDLNAYGVTEMSHAEKVENDGGINLQSCMSTFKQTRIFSFRFIIHSHVSADKSDKSVCR